MKTKSHRIVAKRPRPFAFFFHYNKPESRKRKRNVLTLHAQGACHLVYAIECFRPIGTRNRKTQPRCVMSGTAWNIEITPDFTAYIQ